MRLRLTHQSRPPDSSIQRIWASNMISVATAGVLYVWSRRLLVRAMPRSSEAGRQRSDAAIRSMRSTPAGEHAATHRPPSAAKHFWGAK